MKYLLLFLLALPLPALADPDQRGLFPTGDGVELVTLQASKYSLDLPTSWSQQVKDNTLLARPNEVHDIAVLAFVMTTQDPQAEPAIPLEEIGQKLAPMLSIDTIDEANEQGISKATAHYDDGREATLLLRVLTSDRHLTLVIVGGGEAALFAAYAPLLYQILSTATFNSSP